MIRFFLISKKLEYKKRRWIQLPEIDIRIGGLIDFRQWYAVRFPIDERGETYEAYWILEHEIDSLKKEYPEAEIVRLPKWKTMFPR